jgi:hypothetical protein
MSSTTWSNSRSSLNIPEASSDFPFLLDVQSPADAGYPLK